MKGIVIKGRVDYVRKFHGEEALEKVLESVSPTARASLGGEILVSSWYPLGDAIEFMVAIDRLFGRGDLALCREIGRYTARLALAGGVHRSFAKQNDPAFVIKIGPVLWQQYYDSGKVEAELTGEETGVMRVRGFDGSHRVLCLGLLGWVEEAVEIWGGTDVKVVETKCRVHGHDCCEFVTTWKAPPVDGEP